MSDPIFGTFYYFADGDPLEFDMTPGLLYPMDWRRAQPLSVPVLRDANATAGTWPEVVTLEHVTVHYGPEGPGWLEVPLFAGDPERAVWRRRKWWGRGPIVFHPWGRAAALITIDIESVCGIFSDWQ